MMNYKILDRVFEFGYIEKCQTRFLGMNRRSSEP